MEKIKKVSAFLFIAVSIHAQDSLRSSWTVLAEKEGLNISFIFYSEADNYNNGVVLKLHNKNDKDIFYEFDLIFRSENFDKTEHIEGIIMKNQIKAGSNDNLFWIPFEDGKLISEVGITSIRISDLLPDKNKSQNR